jgi:hypothetical protein
LDKMIDLLFSQQNMSAFIKLPAILSLM